MAVAPPPRSRAACSSFSIDRAAATSTAPASASASAVASPIPEEAPVTTATLPESDLSILVSTVESGWVGPACGSRPHLWRYQQLDLYTAAAPSPSTLSL